MKILNVLFLAIAMFFTVNATAQTVTLKVPEKKASVGFQIDKDAHKTAETITIESKSFPVFKTASGSPYVISVGKSGKEYPVWIGTEHESFKLADGSKVRVSKGGKACVAYLKSNGHPHVRYMEIEQ